MMQGPAGLREAGVALVTALVLMLVTAMMGMPANPRATSATARSHSRLRKRRWRMPSAISRAPPLQRREEQPCSMPARPV
jgi:Tfp pilus assembly protein PilX